MDSIALKKVRHGEEEIFEVIIKDPFGKRIDRWVVMKTNFGDILRMISNKFNLGLWITDKKKKKADDLSWIK